LLERRSAGEYLAARTLHLVPDGRGPGLRQARRQVGDGDATTRDAGFATLRCTDHLVVDLEALLIGLLAAVRPAPRFNRGPDGSRLGAYFGQLIGRLLLRCDA
jgi:hypothetical protein